MYFNDPGRRLRRLATFALACSLAPACVESDSPGESPTDALETSEGDTAAGLDPAGTSTTSGTSSGSTEATTSTTGTSTTTGVDTSTSDHGGDDPECGDGEVQPPEECDLEDENIDQGECKGDCTWNVCGDGKKYEGVEECDLGMANSNGPHCGGCSAETCTLGPYCGDGHLDAECGEICDGGESPNGLACADTCRLETAKFVFITPGAYTGKLIGYTDREVEGGVEAADWICHDLADAAGLVEPPAENEMPFQTPQFRAWISSHEKPVDERLNKSHTGEYVTRDGTIVAMGWDGLTDGALDAPILTGPTLNDAIPGALVWTNTEPDGSFYEIELSCVNWISDSQDSDGALGFSGSVDAWTYIAGDLGKASCNAERRLYCIEQ